MILPVSPRTADPLHVLFVGGGTVGHLAPGFALAETLRTRGLSARFATPGESVEAGWFPADEPPPLRSRAPRFPRRAAGLPGFAGRLGAAVLQAQTLLRQTRPRVVVGLGGWPCVPAALAARLSGIPLVLVVSDARPGLAVRRLAPLAARIYVVDARAAGLLGACDKVRRTGPVLRRAALAGRRSPARFGLEGDRRTLLVVGGSLGARALNLIVAQGVELAVARDPGLARRVQVLHAVGRSGEGVREAYRRANVAHHVTDFLRAMGDAYATADLAVCRAGALTCAELRAVRLPAVLVPYPHHADRQQYENARPLLERGGARLVDEHDLQPSVVADEILPLLHDDLRLDGMAERMGAGNSGGTDQIVADLVRLLQRGPRMSRAAESPTG